LSVFQGGILVGELYLNWSTVSLVFLVLEALLPLLWLLGNVFLIFPNISPVYSV
jgi:hypothetical protein